MIKKFLIGTLVVAMFAVTASLASAADFGSTTLKVGSRGEAVKALQTLVGATPIDGVFGPMTKAKVMAWQATNGLTADGLFGSMSKAKATNGSSVVGGTTCPVGQFDPATGKACGTVSTTLPAGCTTTAGFSPLTGVSCGSASVSTGPLTGGVGSMILSETSTNVEDTVKEDSSEKVLAFKGEADGSDIALTSVKLVFAKESGTASERLTDYIDSVKVLQGSTVVGSADADSFTRDSGSPDIFSKTIALSNAVIREGNKDTFYVEVTAGSIDTDNQDAHWTVALDATRYTDATGVILSDSNIDDDYTMTSGPNDANFTFSDIAVDDKISIKSSSSNPIATNLQVETNATSDEYLVGAFKLDVDSDSSDIQINEIPVTLTVGVNAIDNGTGNADSIFDNVMVKIGSKEYTAELDTDFGAATGTATYLVTLDDGDVVINAGDTEDVKIYITLNDQENNYSANTTVVAGVAMLDVDAESVTSGDTVVLTGSSFTSKVHTLIANGAAVSFVSGSYTAYSVDNGDGTISMKFKVSALGDEDVTVAEDASTLAYVVTGITGGNITTGGIVTSSDLTVDGSDNFIVSAGDEATFTLAVKTGVPTGFVRLEITSVDGTSVTNIKTAAY